MTTSGDISVASDAQSHVKLHPYLVTLVRWCVSCLWSTATVLLQRLMAAPLQPITGPKPGGRSARRGAGTEHLHPEPRVECQLLHQPRDHALDVIFVHGLYGSLGNTWRQGDWRHKYQVEPKKVTLRNHSPKRCQCHKNSLRTQNHHIYNGKTPDNQNKCNDNNDNSYESQNNYIYNVNNDNNQNKCNDSSYKSQNSYIYNGNENKCNSNDDLYNITDLDSQMNLNKINEKLFKKILPKDNDLITEQFYNNTLLDQVEIVDNYDTQAKFVRDLFHRENNCDNCDNDNGNKCKYERTYNECKCNKQCEAGCGCVCDNCYSTCWPRDWIKEDFPGARVISINYTSDPYLWRPLWIKENKRLSLHERAEQMTQQLLAMGVGSKPIVWVGHSKGGLFIKQIYNKAYESHQKLNKTDIATEPKDISDQIYKKNINDDVIAETIDNIVGSMFDNKEMYKQHNYKDNLKHTNNIYETNSIKNMYNDRLQESAKIYSDVEINVNVTSLNVTHNDNICNNNNGNEHDSEESSNIEELCSRARLYSRSAGFMFYSVPHGGSPLAGIKTPVTARSLELLEISKDCELVRRLHDGWLEAARAAKPAVRGCVETCRTLMSVLWLRIVSPHSADAGLGTLLGVSVDHREICKPASRRCSLYIELVTLIHEALHKCEY